MCRLNQRNFENSCRVDKPLISNGKNHLLEAGKEKIINKTKRHWPV